MNSLFRYPGFKSGKFRAVVTNNKIQLLEDSKVIDECSTKDNNLLYDIHVGYTDIRCDVEGSLRTMMYVTVNDGKLRNYTFKEVLDVLVAKNKLPIEEPVIMPDNWSFDY